MNHRALQPWSLLCVAAIAAVVFALKAHYSSASAEELRWILAPTSALVGLVVGSDFVFEAGTGWFSQEEMFAIAPVCAGVNFLLAAFLTLSLAAVFRLRRPWMRLCAIPASLALATLLTIVVNTIRISIALRAPSLGESLATGDALHRTQGITVFFLALCLVYWVTDKLLPTQVPDAT